MRGEQEEEEHCLRRDAVVRSNTELGRYVFALRMEAYGRIGMAREAIDKMQSIDYPDEARKKSFLDAQNTFVHGMEGALKHMIGAERLTHWGVDQCAIRTQKEIAVMGDYELIAEVHAISVLLFPNQDEKIQS